MALINYKIRERYEQLKKRGDRLDDIKRIIDWEGLRPLLKDLFTNTQFPAREILKIYGEKDVVEKAFSHVKPHLEPFFSRAEEGTRARLFLTILGYTMIAIMAAKCNVTYNRVLETISGIREVVYADGYHAHVEYTKEERELMEKLKIER